MQHQLANGHFQTTVQPVDDYGHAYTPGQSYSPATSSGPRRVGGDLPPDPFAGDAAPIGEIPFVLFALMFVAYAIYRKKHTI
ncbi:MAG: hypothetical protein J6T80_04615 [Paludibacteraceae bacterium]|nr:hypothetical protein [Paludibacteraceae bacterium]